MIKEEILQLVTKRDQLKNKNPLALATSDKAKKPTLKDNGISHYQSKTFQKIALLPQEISEEEIATAKEETN